MLNSKTALACAALYFCIFLGSVVGAQTSLEDLLSKIKAVADNPNATVEELQRTRDLMDEVVGDHPTTDSAVAVMLRYAHGGIDFGQLDARIRAITDPQDSDLSRGNAQAPSKVLIAPARAEKDKTNTERDAGSTDQVSLIGETFVSPPAVIGKLAEIQLCLKDNMQRDVSQSITVDVKIGSFGEVKGIPELASPQSVSNEARSLYLGMLGALDTCAPYADVISNGAALVTVAHDGSVAFVPVSGANIDQSEIRLTALQAAPEVPAIDPTTLPVANEQQENKLDLDRQAVRDIQARLLVAGFDPNGIDGVKGRGTRSAIRSWQGAAGVPVSGFLNAPQLKYLKQETQTALDTWLEDEKNVRAYKQQKRRPKQLVRMCNRGVFGILYNCRNVWR